MKAPRALLFAILLAAMAVAAIFLPVEAIATTIQQWAAANPSAAAYLVTGCIALGIVLLLPLSLMFMLAGLLFGLLKGFLVSWVAFLLSSSIAYWLGRTFARPWIERKMRRNALFSSIDRAIERKGFLVVLLTRLVMVFPYQLLNYALGLTRVGFKDCALASGIGSIPSIFLFVYLGTTVNSVASIMSGEVELQENDLFIGILALVTLVVSILLIVRIASRALREELTTQKE